MFKKCATLFLFFVCLFVFVVSRMPLIYETFYRYLHGPLAHSSIISMVTGRQVKQQDPGTLKHLSRNIPALDPNESLTPDSVPISCAGYE